MFMLSFVTSDVGLLNKPFQDKYNCAWFMDINGGWSDYKNLIAGGLVDLNRRSDIILELVVMHNITPLINTSLGHILFDVRLLTVTNI